MPCPPGWRDRGHGMCGCMVAGQDEVVATSAEAWKAYTVNGPCSSPPPPPPPPPPPSPPHACPPPVCPTTFTIVQGPACPVYVAIQGTPDSWTAAGVQLSEGWKVLQTVTMDAAQVTQIVNNLATLCINKTIQTVQTKKLPPPP